MLSINNKCLSTIKSVMSYGFSNNQIMLLSPLIRKMLSYRTIKVCTNLDDYISEISNYEILICNGSIDYYELYDVLKISKKKNINVIVINWERLSTIRAKYIKIFDVNYVLTDFSNESEISDCISAIKSNKKYYSPLFYSILESKTSNRMEYSEIFENFSNREKLVFNFMIQGVKQERIAYILKLNKNTIATYCSRVLKKSGVNTVLELYRKFALGSVC